MIIKLKNSVSKKEINKLKIDHKAFHVKSENNHLLITSSGLKDLPDSLVNITDDFWVFENDMQLASKSFKSQKYLRFLN